VGNNIVEVETLRWENWLLCRFCLGLFWSGTCTLQNQTDRNELVSSAVARRICHPSRQDPGLNTQHKSSADPALFAATCLRSAVL
jgi:hypothetical protein